MPWYGYDRHKSRILIGSRSFCHGFYFRVTANYCLFGNVFIEPFVGLHWLGKGSHGVNRVYGRTLVKGNSWVTGVSVVYAF